MTYPVTKQLLFECPAGVKPASAPDVAFTTFDGVNCLVLPCERGNYTPVKNYAGSPPKLIRTFGTPVAQIRAYSYEIDLKVVDQRYWIYRTLQRISRHFKVGRSKTPFRLFDFVLPEDEDVEAADVAGTEAYTTRLVVLNELKPNGGVVGQFDSPDAWMKDGFSARLEDLQERID